jgi:hypothetical protein
MSNILDYLCDWLEYGGERADRRCDARIRMDIRDDNLRDKMKREDEAKKRREGKQ